MPKSYIIENMTHQGGLCNYSNKLFFNNWASKG